jgi:hypothetical protein
VEEMEGGDETEEEMEGGKEQTYLSRAHRRRYEGESGGGVAFRGRKARCAVVPRASVVPVCNRVERYSRGLEGVGLGQKPILPLPNVFF